MKKLLPSHLLGWPLFPWSCVQPASTPAPVPQRDQRGRPRTGCGGWRGELPHPEEANGVSRERVEWGSSLRCLWASGRQSTAREASTSGPHRATLGSLLNSPPNGRILYASPATPVTGWAGCVYSRVSSGMSLGQAVGRSDPGPKSASLVLFGHQSTTLEFRHE